MSAPVTTQPATDHARVRAARYGVFAVFAANGAVFATWASRIPDVARQLELSPGALGATMLAMSVGSIIGLPLSGKLSDLVGSARACLIGATILSAGLLVMAFAIDVATSRGLLMAGLFSFGLGFGLVDVAMNLEGADVERTHGRTIMPWFHAAFSGGTVLSAIIGALASGLRLPIGWHFVIALLIAMAALGWGVQHYLPRTMEQSVEEATEKLPTSTAWLEPRTLLIGVMVLIAAFTEGTANDWIALALHKGYELPEWAGVLGFASFLTFMTAGRILGAQLLDRHGRIVVLRALFSLAAVGSLLVVFGGPVLAFVGTAMWGLGASLGFPVGMSAAADNQRRAAARISVVSTIGYVAFLAGPPALGLLGEQVGVLRSLLVVGVGAAIALLVVPAAKEDPAY